MNLKDINNLDQLIKLATYLSITDEMRDHFDKRTEYHINLVRKYCRKIADAFGETFEGIIERGEEHDDSKKKAPELDPYIFITWDYKLKGDGNEDGAGFPDEIKDLMNRASNHHIQSNKHHPEFHCPHKKNNMINREDRDAIPDEMIDVTIMSHLDIAEMCSDWCAMGEEKKDSPYEWAKKNVNKRWKFTDTQEKMIYKILDKIWETEE